MESPQPQKFNWVNIIASLVVVLIGSFAAASFATKDLDKRELYQKIDSKAEFDYVDQHDEMLRNDFQDYMRVLEDTHNEKMEAMEKNSNREIDMLQESLNRQIHLLEELVKAQKK